MGDPTAVFYNLSLTTDDFWSMGFSFVAENMAPLPLFYPSLALIVGGTVLYEITGTTNSSDLDDADARRHSGEVPQQENEKHHQYCVEEERETEDETAAE